MSLVSQKFTNQAFSDKLLNGVVMIYIGNSMTPWTGTVVGAKNNQTIIFTAAHCLKVPGMSIERASQLLTVRFLNDRMVYPAQAVLYIKESEILLLRINRKTESRYKFKFAPKEQHALKKYQPIGTYAHPNGYVYQSSEGTICGEELENRHLGFDEKLKFFHHRMDLPPGCSGASIFNDSGFIIGLHSGGYATHVSVVRADPLENLLSNKEKELKEQESKERESKLKASLNDEIEHASASLANLSFRREDIVPLRVLQSSMHIAVHVKYIDEVLRTKVFHNMLDPLDKLIEDKYLSGSGAGSSGYGAGSSSGSGASSRHPDRRS